jgi:hypothetical protein
MVHQTVRCVISARTQVFGDELIALGNRIKRAAKIHRTAQWCIGLSGEPVALAANGRLRNLRATRGPLQQSVRHTGLSGAPTDPEDQRSAAPDMEGDHTPDCYSSCLVVH